MLKDKICAYIDSIKEQLVEISQKIHAHPELSFEEKFASKLLAKTLEESGFKVTLGVAELETAFYAEHPEQSEGLTLALLAEYDALPGIGHGCGHNLIATASLGASLALGAIKSQLPGKLICMGTPAEEGGGGKVIMIEAGLFKNIDAAMMFHPSAIHTMTGRGGLAVQEIKIEFKGKAAHASSEPESGINALDGVIQTFNGISALRQHIKSDARIHGVITHGGLKPNIVPDYAAASFYIRALEDSYCEELIEKVNKCAQGAALATGAALTFSRVGPGYKSRSVNRTMGKAFEKNLERLKIPLNPIKPGSGLGSSDIGNVSKECPTIHPYLAISEVEINAHSQDFAKAAISEKGHEAMINAAKALAMTAVDIYTDTQLQEKMMEEFQTMKR